MNVQAPKDPPDGGTIGNRPEGYWRAVLDGRLPDPPAQASGDNVTGNSGFSRAFEAVATAQALDNAEGFVLGDPPNVPLCVDAERRPDPSMVICPHCNHQFTAISEKDQQALREAHTALLRLTHGQEPVPGPCG